MTDHALQIMNMFKAHALGMPCTQCARSVKFWMPANTRTLPPPPLCNSYALVIATVSVGTVLIWYLILIRYKCSAAA